MSAEKVRENKARRAAERQGLRLVKSRRRDPRALDFGLYLLSDLTSRAAIGPWRDLDSVETYLNTPAADR